MTVITFLIVLLTGSFQQGQVKNINQAEFQKMSKDKNTVVIDVRTPDEIKQGYIPGTTKFFDINGAGFESQIKSLDKTKTYLMVCRSGARSSRAAQLMMSKGFTKVYNLSGGVLNWQGTLTK